MFEKIHKHIQLCKELRSVSFFMNQSIAQKNGERETMGTKSNHFVHLPSNHLAAEYVLISEAKVSHRATQPYFVVMSTHRKR